MGIQLLRQGNPSSRFSYEQPGRGMTRKTKPLDKEIVERPYQGRLMMVTSHAK